MKYVRAKSEYCSGEPSGWVASGRFVGQTVVTIGKITFTAGQIEVLKDTRLADVRGIRFLQEDGEITIELV